MIIDTKTTSPAPAMEPPQAEDQSAVKEGSSSVWKQEAIEQSNLLGKLMSEDFDQATFLYKMYKSCTVGEIEDFKMSLADVRAGTIKSASRDTLTSKSVEIAQLVSDMVQLDSTAKLKLQPEMTKLEETSLRLQHSLLSQIQQLQGQASRLVTSQRCEEILRESQLIFECLQQVSYSYNFSQRKILDPLSLSVALKQLGVLSPDQKAKLAANIPQLGQKLDLLRDVQTVLEKQTLAKFQEAFDNKDRQALVQCIQVFFNMEILSDQVQSRTNVYLKELHALWVTKLKDLNEQIQRQKTLADEAALVEKTITVFVQKMTASTFKVYQMSLALSEQDPTSSAATSFEAMQETLSQTGLSNVFRLYWDMLCKIIKMRLQACSTEYPYVYGSMASRYPSFVRVMKDFWSTVLSGIQPTDKIRLLELKQIFFASFDALKTAYYENCVLKELMDHRVQITEVLTSSFENLDKYKIVAQKKKQAEQVVPQKIVNPYAALSESLKAEAIDLQSQERQSLSASVTDFLSAMHRHLDTVGTQTDIRSQVVEICKGQLKQLLQGDLLNSIVKFQISEAQEYEHQLAYNMVIFDLAKLVAQYFASQGYSKLLQVDKQIKVDSLQLKTQRTDDDLLSLTRFKTEAQEMCSKLFEKIYNVFISHLKTEIYPALARVTSDLPKPLQADDLSFAEERKDVTPVPAANPYKQAQAQAAQSQPATPEEESAEGDDGGEGSSQEEEQLSFEQKVAHWKQGHLEDVIGTFIPQSVKEFNEDFASVVERMTLEGLLQQGVERQEQWILRERRVKLIECVDEILHFYMLRAIQVDLKSYASHEREIVYLAFDEMYGALVRSFGDLVEIKLDSRMVKKHRDLLRLVHGEDSEEAEQKLPMHVQVCLGQAGVKTISARNLYICEKSMIKASLLDQPYLAKSAATIAEKTLQDIRRVFSAPADESTTQDAEAVIDREDKLALIDAKLQQVQAVVLKHKDV